MRPVLLCLCTLACTCVMNVERANAQKAGRGTYQPKILRRDGAPTDTIAFKKGSHYLRVEELCWFVNDEGNLLKDRMVSGTVDLRLGNESYQVVLGTYTLSGGNRVAPLFNSAILDNRVYTGGDLRIVVFIKGIKKNTVIGDLLMNVAKSTLGVASGAVGTATAFGSSAILTNAGRELLTGVQGVLNSGESQYGIFEERGGLDYTIPKSSLVGRENFYLAYRGNDLSGKQVVVSDSGQGVYDVVVDGKPLRGGAWILFRISREDCYGNARPWHSKAEKARGELDDLMQNWRIGVKTMNEVSLELASTLQNSTVGDRLMAVRSEIRADEILTESERGLEAARLVSLLSIAQGVCKAPDGYDQYFRAKDNLHKTLMSGTEPQPPCAKAAFLQESTLVAREAQATFLRDFKEKFGDARSVLGERALETLGKTGGGKTFVPSIDYSKVPPAIRQQVEQAVMAYPAPTPTERELWERFGEIERAKAAKRNPERPHG